MSISVSLLSSYLYCPRKIFLERVLGFFEPLKEALAIGSIKHEIFDLINKTEKEIVINIKEKMPLEELQETYKSIYSKILQDTIIKNDEKLKKLQLNAEDIFEKTLPLVLNEMQIRSLNTFKFMQANMVYGVELWEKLMPKIHSEFKISSNILGLNGVIDQLEIYENSCIPIELKTGMPPKEAAWQNHKIQIAAYAMLLEEKYSTTIKEGFVYYIDANERRHIPINIFLKEEIKQLIKEVKALLESREMPDFCENKNKCNGCGLKDVCYDEKKLKKRQKELLKQNQIVKNHPS